MINTIFHSFIKNIYIQFFKYTLSLLSLKDVIYYNILIIINIINNQFKYINNKIIIYISQSKRIMI